MYSSQLVPTTPHCKAFGDESQPFFTFYRTVKIRLFCMGVVGRFESATMILLLITAEKGLI
jgi:hypothetical protein